MNTDITMSRRFTRTPLLLLAIAMLVGLTACDQSEQNIGYSPGDTLAIDGPSSVAVPSTEVYSVKAGSSIEEDYTWTVNGEAVPPLESRGDQFIAYDFTEPGTYEIEVEGTVDGEVYVGTLTVNAVAE